MAAKFLVISQTHSLLPFSWRLKKDGYDVEVLVEKDRFERAWEGRLDRFKVVSGHDKRAGSQRAAVRGEAEAKGQWVLTDSPRWTRDFLGYERLLPTLSHHDGAEGDIWLGAWFDGEQFQGRHLLIEDRGLWPGGLGPDVVAGATLVRPNEWPEALEETLHPLADHFKAGGYRGLVRVRKDHRNGETVWRAGWGSLQAHAFVAELGDAGAGFGAVIEGAEPVFPHRFTVVLAVSIPPWPLRCDVKPETPPIPPEVVKTGAVFLHDMRVEEDGPRGAGTDGLIGVARWSAHSLKLAQQRVREIAAAMELPQAQWRPDVGGKVETVLAGIEAEMGVGV